VTRTTPEARLNFSLSGDNLYGRETVREMAGNVSSRRVRRARTDDNYLFHRSKNGVYDPISYFHVLELIAQLAPGSEFRTADLMEALKYYKPQLVWDATTVGRILADLSETMHEVHGFAPIDHTRRWNGMYFSLSTQEGARIAIYRLVEDLRELSMEQVKEELLGNPPKRIASPLDRCPSLR
jgi:hypothetical protein